MQVTNERNNGGYKTTPVILQRTPGKALKALISCEFGFGGIELSRADTSLTVRTRVMGCVDDTTIEGSVDEIVLFHKASDVCNAVRHLRDSGEPIASIEKAIKEVPWSFAETARSIMGNANTAKVIGVLLLEIEDVDLLREVLKLSSDEVLTLLELKVDEKASEEEMLGLVA